MIKRTSSESSKREDIKNQNIPGAASGAPIATANTKNPINLLVKGRGRPFGRTKQKKGTHGCTWRKES